MTLTQSRLLRRPFAGLHWTVLWVIVASWAYVFFGKPCNKGPYYFEAFVLAATVFAAFLSGVRLANSQASRNKVVDAAVTGARDLVVLVVAAVVITVLFLPAYQCYVAK